MFKRKNSGMGINDVDKKKSTVVGYASKFGNIDSHGDIVVRGAFKRTLDHNSKRVKTLMHHDPVQVVGRPMLMREDERGLYTETKVSDTAAGRDLLTLIEDGVIDEMSIGFIPVREEYDNEKSANIIQEVKLIEYSFVTLASNPEARVEGVKGTAALNEITSSMRRMEKALRNGVFYSDEIPEQLEFIVKYWRSVLESTVDDVVDSDDVVESFQPSGDSPEGTPLTKLDSVDTTRDEVLGVLKDWQAKQSVLDKIALLGHQLGGK